jgi:hypothetical protein
MIANLYYISCIRSRNSKNCNKTYALAECLGVGAVAYAIIRKRSRMVETFASFPIVGISDAQTAKHDFWNTNTIGNLSKGTSNREHGIQRVPMRMWF